jgi:hypothetical protein
VYDHTKNTCPLLLVADHRFFKNMGRSEESTTLNYLVSLVSLVVFYVYYTHPEGCTENKVFISINMLLCLGASVVSVLPQIQVSLYRELSPPPKRR